MPEVKSPSLFGRFRSGFLRDSIASFALKITATGLSFITGILLARLLGVGGFGVYSYAMALVVFLGVPAIFGLDRLLLREIAAYRAQSQWGLMRGLINWSDRLALFSSLGLMLIAVVFVISPLGGSLDTQMKNAFLAGIFLLPFLTLLRLKEAAMRGLHYVVSGQMPEALARPLLFLALLGGLYLYKGNQLTATSVIVINVVAYAVVFLAMIKVAGMIFSRSIKEKPCRYDKRSWVRSAMPMLFISGMYIILGKTDVIVLGAIRGADAVGVYTAASRGAEFMAFAIFSINAILAPSVASLYAGKDMERLQRVVTKSARMIVFLSLPIFLGLVFLGDWFLLLFGGDFVRGETALTILCIGYFINALMGSVGLLLVMTGNELAASVGVGLSAVVNIILNLLLIPKWGMEGAAVATALSMVLWNIVMVMFVWKRLGINPTALGRLKSG